MRSEELIGAIRDAAAEGALPGPEVLRALAESPDAALVRQVARLWRRLDMHGVPSLNVHVLSSATCGPFPELLRTILIAHGRVPNISVAEYTEFSLSLATSQFASDEGPDVVIVTIHDGHFLPADWPGDGTARLVGELNGRVDDLCALVAACADRVGVPLFLHTVPLPATVRDGLISWKDRAALASAWSGLNQRLLDLSAQCRNVYVSDLAGLLAGVPVAARDDRLYRYAHLPYTDDALLVLAQEAGRFIRAHGGLARKLLALDLDGTLWGGVLGEVGAEGLELGGLYPGNCYLELQRTAKRLRDQGVVLALVSKNDADHVEEVLTAHPEMVLRPPMFSAQAVNWLPKAGNLRTIAGRLNLGVESMVLLDDSPFERGAVRAELPEIVVLAADGDPAHLVHTVLHGGWFDVLGLTTTDRRRPELYQARAARMDYAAQYATPEDYLRALDIEVDVSPVDRLAVARAAQLSARTNQFNLTGVRFTEAETLAMIEAPDGLVLSCSTRDRLGDDGVVGIAWIHCGQTWKVENLVLSCRVLGRGIELAFAGVIVKLAAAAGATAVRARYVASPRNSVAEDLWRRAGFGRVGDGMHGIDYELTFGPAPELVPAWIRIRERAAT